LLTAVKHADDRRHAPHSRHEMENAPDARGGWFWATNIVAKPTRTSPFAVPE